MNLQEISFPVYLLNKNKPDSHDGVISYTTLHIDEDNPEELVSVTKIVDNTSIPGETLAKRRLYIASTNLDVLYKIHRSFYSIVDIIKLKNKTKYWFIDSLGKLFQYKGNTRCHVVCKELSGFSYGNSGYYMSVKGLPYKMYTKYKPLPGQRFAAIIYIQGTPMLYGFTDKAFKKTWKLV